MTASVGSVMRYCRNYFEVGYVDGTFRITGNALHGAGDGVHWVHISGSIMHDGVWEICNGYLTGRSVEGLEDEEFDGRVWLLAPTMEFIDLCKEIQEYEKKNPLGSFASESFGEYRYTRRFAADGKNDWQTTFAAQIAPYVRMYTEVR